MADRVRMNFPQMEEMAAAFNQSAAQMEETQGVMKEVVGLLSENGDESGLLGIAGDSFVDAINGPLMQALTTLQDKFTELEGDIKQTVSDFQSMSQSTVSSKFQ